MNVAETLLRLGCALVAWMVVLAHLVWLLALRNVGCDADGDNLWRLLFGFAAFTIGFAFLLPVSRKLREVHDILRWLAVPTGLLLLLALFPVWQAFSASTLGGAPICTEQAAWHLWWAPVQLLAMSALGWNLWRVWR